MAKGISFFLVLLFFSCSSIKNNSNNFTEDLNLTMALCGEGNSLSVELCCRNNSSHSLKIPLFFTSLKADEIRLHKFRSNWLEILREDGSRVGYLGIYCEPTLYSLEKETMILGKGKEFVITINDIYYNYDFIPGEKVSMKYYGPLGESNPVEFSVCEDLSEY